ncbi:MAG: 3'-5' exonuclease, partial [Fusobacteriaceae bacterium]
IKRKIKDESITNAEVFTFHGLAFDYFKDSDQIVKFADRVMVNLDYFTLEQIVKVLDIDKRLINRLLEALFVFLRGGKSFSKSFENEEDVIREHCRTILRYVRTEQKSPMFHEYYIKMFQLMMYSNSKYDAILVDESQDKTSCYEQIISNMKTRRVIHFGDNQQQIYAYNGAVGMETSNFRLTKSYRIGKQHSDICNALVMDILKTDSTNFEGVNPNGVIVDKLSNIDKPTVICRTNKELILRTLEEIKKNKIVHVLGGLPIDSELIKNIYTATNDKPFYFKNKKISSFNDAKKLFAISSSSELKNALEFIMNFGSDTLSVVNTIRNKTIKEHKLADVSLVTAHKSKGLEFECVEISDDFPQIEKIKEKKNHAELYTLYVALSRSTGKLMLNNDLKSWYDKFKEGKTKDNIITYKDLESLF